MNTTVGRQAHANRETTATRQHLARRAIPTLWAVAPLALLDAVGISLAMTAAHSLRFQVLEYYGQPSALFYLRLAAIGIPMWLGIFALNRLYDPDRLFGGLHEYAAVVNGCLGGVAGLIIYSFVDRTVNQEISRGWLAITWLLAVVTVGGTRFAYRRLIYNLRQRGLFTRRALIVGANDEGSLVAAQLHITPTADARAIGFVDPHLPVGSELADLPVMGNLQALERLVRQYEVQELIVISTALDRESLLGIYRDWGMQNRVRISLSSGLYELFTTGVDVRETGFVPLVTLHRTRITGLDAVLKATLDRVGAALGLLLLSPLLAAIALLIRRDSPGPILHRRRVVGLHGREFDAWKFRTMIPDADQYLQQHPELEREWATTGKIQNDPRITRIGRLLRRYSLDELPQLCNVLQGQMSLVGPRMITPAELVHFGRWQYNLLTVKPGLTGPWQIGGRSNLSYQERVRMDMHYIRNYTIWLDLKVLFNTLQAVLQGRGAY